MRSARTMPTASNAIAVRTGRPTPNRHGFDLVVITDPLDTSERATGAVPRGRNVSSLALRTSPDYDRVVWVDSDICINPAAPSIADGIPPERIGAVTSTAFHRRRAAGDSWRRSSRSHPTPATRTSDFWRGMARSRRMAPLTRGCRWARLISCRPACSCFRRSITAVCLSTCMRCTRSVAASSSTTKCVRSRTRSRCIASSSGSIRGSMHSSGGCSSTRTPAPTPIASRASSQENYRRSFFLHFAGCAHLMPLAPRA